MIIKQTIRDGKFLTATTRKANYSEHYFAKYTIWPSKRAFDSGDCRDVIEMINLYVGTDPSTFRETILESANKTWKENEE